MTVYRFVSTWQHVYDVEAETPEAAHVAAADVALDRPCSIRVDVELVGEVDANGGTHPIGQGQLTVTP